MGVGTDHFRRIRFRIPTICKPYAEIQRKPRAVARAFRRHRNLNPDNSLN